MKSGRTLWEALVDHYDRGVSQVGELKVHWQSLEGAIDRERLREVSAYLDIQAKEARWWRDASLAYWMSVNGLDLPAGTEPPAHDLGYYKALEFPNAPGQGE